MTVRTYAGLAGLLLAAVTLSFGTFKATAQPHPGPATTPSVYPVPLNPQGYVPPPTHTQPSLPEMIAELKELRKKEQDLTKAIKEKIKSQKQSLDDAEKELDKLGIDANAGQSSSSLNKNLR
jgi:hypothetical protein